MVYADLFLPRLDRCVRVSSLEGAAVQRHCGHKTENKASRLMVYAFTQLLAQAEGTAHNSLGQKHFGAT